MSRDKNDNSDLSLKPGPLSFSEEERRKILEIALERMVLIDSKAYGIEDDAEPQAAADCESKIKSCRAVCYTYTFALTQEEAGEGIVKYNAAQPYYIARDEDGYCPHLDRTTFRCNIHEKRPLRCRKYACRQDNCA
jgi:Fe-S-cluster containining protein